MRRNPNTPDLLLLPRQRGASGLHFDCAGERSVQDVGCGRRATAEQSRAFSASGWVVPYSVSGV